jgi:glutamate synthase (NADPH/NADH) large chain
MDDLIGRYDLLQILDGETQKQSQLDLGPLLHETDDVTLKPRYCQQPGNTPFDKAELAEKILADALSAIDNRTGLELSYQLRNDNRSIGARLSGEIAKRYGNLGMESTPLIIRFSGTAGQSFGVWNCGGLHLHLEGDANDYVGKGMSGGKIVIYPPSIPNYNSQENVIIGNTCLYGATGGVLYAAGLAGERLAVRNSNALAVVEGAGDHCCEYMTGGVVIVLGSTGINFGAGMTGGFAFVLDRHNTFVDHYNHTHVDIHRIDTEDTEAHRNFLRNTIIDYIEETGSRWAQQIIDDFTSYVGKFWLVKPESASLMSIIESKEQAA